MKQLTAWMMIIGSALVAQAGEVKVKAVVTYAPGGESVTTFQPGIPKIYATFKTTGAQKGDEMRAVWIAEDVGDAAPANTKVEETKATLEGDNGNGTFSLSQPKNGWPEGKYRVEIYANNELATKVKFAIKLMGKAEQRDSAEKADREAGIPAPNLTGKWIGYYDDGSKSEYVWSIKQTGTDLAISNVGGQTARSTGFLQGSKVVAQDFATSHGTLSDDGRKITWSDGVVWKKQ